MLHCGFRKSGMPAYGYCAWLWHAKYQPRKHGGSQAARFKVQIMTALLFQAASKSSLFDTLANLFRDIVANLEKSGRATYEAHRYGIGGL
jgi:hypothetical protein